MIVAIDGPAGAGKSSVARGLAARLGFHYLDTGAMYRALTWLALHEGVPLDDGPALEALAQAHPVTFGDAGSGRDRRGRRDDPHPRARDRRGRPGRRPAPGGARGHAQRASASSAASGDSVIEGRDIGVVVVPDAEVKVWLVADPAVRARRRHLERDGLEIEELAEELRRRDERDAINTHRADDAVEVDTTELSLDEVIDRIAGLVEAAR